jgi:hypothetical protein
MKIKIKRAWNFKMLKKLCGLGVSAVKRVYRRGAETLRGWPRRSGALQKFMR